MSDKKTEYRLDKIEESQAIGNELFEAITDRIEKIEKAIHGLISNLENINICVDRMAATLSTKH